MIRPRCRHARRFVRLVAGPLAAGAMLAGRGLAEPVVTPLVPDVPDVGDLTISANGQTALAIDGGRGAVVAFDPARPGPHRDVIAAPGDGVPMPVAVACMPGDVVVAVCVDRGTWSLRSFRLRPGGPADPAEPLQTLPIGNAASPATGVGVVVSSVRDWLVIAGLPAPLPPVQRTLFAGVGLRPLAAAAAAVDEGWRPVAAAVSPADELVLVEQPRDADATSWVSFFDATGRRLLRLDTGLPRVRDAAFDRGAGRLWVVAGVPADDTHPEGLWRLDAELREGVQAVRPACVVRLADPRAVVAAAEEALLVATGEPGRSVVRIDSRSGRLEQGPNTPDEEPPR